MLRYSPGARALLVLSVCLIPPLAAQSTRILPRGVVNAAGFSRPGLPNGKIARGSIFSIFGARLGPGALAEQTAFPLTTDLAGVTVTITQGDTTVQAIPIVAVGGQINAIMPSDAPLGKASLQVRNGVRRTNPSPIEIVDSSVGIFTATGVGEGPGSITNFITQSSQPINSQAQTAAPGQTITIWATGLGPAPFPDSQQPGANAGDIEVDVEVFLGGTVVPQQNILYAARSFEFSGLDQIIVTLPDDAPEGCYVPLHIRTNGAIVSNGVTLAIGDCTAPAAPARSGTVLLASVHTEDAIDRAAPLEASADLALAQLTESPGGPFAYDRLRGLPPVGACATYGFAGRVDALGLFQPVGATAVDAGPRLSVSGPRGVRRLDPVDQITGGYGAVLGGLLPEGMAAGLLNGLYLLAGAYQVTTDQAADATVDLTINQPDPVDWTNQDAIRSVDRTQPLTVEWAAPAQSDVAVVVMGYNYDAPTDASAGFACMADASSGSATVPAWVLSTLPASRPEPFQSTGRLRLWTVSGLDSGAATSTLDSLAGIGSALSDRSVLFE